MICPLMAINPDAGSINCRTDCAWYDLNEDQCSIKSLAYILNDIKIDLK